MNNVTCLRTARKNGYNMVCSTLVQIFLYTYLTDIFVYIFIHANAAMIRNAIGAYLCTSCINIHIHLHIHTCSSICIMYVQIYLYTYLYTITRACTRRRNTGMMWCALHFCRLVQHGHAIHLYLFASCMYIYTYNLHVCICPCVYICIYIYIYVIYIYIYSVYKFIYMYTYS